MQNQRLLKIVSNKWLIATLFVVLGSVGYYCFAQRNQVVLFTFHTTLKEQPIAPAAMKRLMASYNACFEDMRRVKLAQFLNTREDLTKIPNAQNLLEHYVDKLLLQARREQEATLKTVPNFYIAWRERELVGFFVCQDDNTYTYDGVMIYSLCVAPELRGQGIGTQLIHHAIDQCRKPGKVLGLTVYREDTVPRKLYEKNDFIFKDPPRGMTDGFESFDKVYMEHSSPLN